MVSDYNFAFYKKEQFWSKFYPLRKIEKSCVNILGGQDSSVSTRCFQISSKF